MRRPVILLDVDGPLTAGYAETVCAYLRDEGVDAHPHLITMWDTFKSFNTPHEVIVRVAARLREPEVAAGFQPREGAYEFVTNLRKWAEVVAVTSPLPGSPTWDFERRVWLTDYLDFHRDDVIGAVDKSRVAGDVLIDDKTGNVSAWSKRWPDGEGILWNASYNVRDVWYPRADDYFDVLGLLAPLKEKCK